MGLINPKFDLRCAKLFARGETGPIVDYLEREIPNAGNGAHEIGHSIPSWRRVI